jgi:chromosome condensin MukBEF complex kleisin-like MukF subunit
LSCQLLGRFCCPLQARAQLIAQGVVQLAQDRLAGEINDEDVKFAFNEIKESEKTQLNAIAVTAKAAAQDAINAALSVATTALNKAIGFALL